jgi:Tol biopolymer transport system component
LPYQDSPSWSPDGEWLAFTETSGESGQRQGMRKVRVGTKESVLLLKELASFSQTRWSPDGRWIICQTFEGLTLVPSDGGAPTVIAPDSYLDFTWSPDGRQVYALADSDTSGHFALIEIDVATRAIKDLNPDLGSIPVANQPIRGFSFVKGQGFLTSLASARSDIWLLEGFQSPSRWADRLFRRVP